MDGKTGAKTAGSAKLKPAGDSIPPCWICLESEEIFMTDFDGIMTKITSGLTGSNREDMAYLKERAEAYKEHPLASEIIRACWRLMYEMLPDDKKEEFAKAIGNDSAGIMSVLDEIRYTAYKNDFGKALSLMESLVKKLDEMNTYADDAVSEYHTFSEPFEEMLYRHRSHPAKALRKALLPYSDIYALHGNILFELKRYDEARRALKKAIRWNPVSAPIAFEHAETYKMTGDMDTYLSLTKDVMGLVFRPKDLARCYRNLGYCFVEKQLFDVAVSCLLLSLQYDKDSPVAQSELYYIQSKVGGEPILPSDKQLDEYAVQYEFPLGASQDVLSLAYAYGKHFLDDKAYDGARYFLEIVYGLTSDGEIRELLDQIPQEDG